MSGQIFSSNYTDKELDGNACLPDVSAAGTIFSAVRSHGPRYRKKHWGENTNNAQPDENTIKIQPLRMMPSGDVVVAVTGIADDNFDDIKVQDFLSGTITKIGKATADHEGAATFTALVKGTQSVYFHQSGDCIVSVIYNDQNGVAQVTQLTMDNIATQETEINKQKFITACPATYIGRHYAYTIDYARYIDAVELKYEDLENDFGPNALIMISTDGFYDGVKHPEYKHFEDDEEQTTYLEKLGLELQTIHQNYLLDAVNALTAKGYAITEPNYAQLLARHVRTNSKNPMLQHPSSDDIGIICINASRPASAAEQGVFAVFDAIGSLGTEGVITARTAANIVEEEAKKISLAPQEQLHAFIFNHMETPRQTANCTIGYYNTGDSNNIVVCFPSMTEFDRSTQYEQALRFLPAVFYVNNVTVNRNETHTYVTLPPEQIAALPNVVDFLKERVFGDNAVPSNFRIDESINMLASAEFLQHESYREVSARLQAQTQPQQVVR